ncbi:hypothetical protein [Bifidobacterium animalis]|uniref:hypothetical protein n=1 Tax=Bifidobacterium animalis TaxID=28025 RepID=UPI003F91BA89
MSTYALDAVRAKYAENHPESPEWVEFTITSEPDAKTYRIHHPLWQTDTEKEAMQQAAATNDDLAYARALLGDQYDAYKADGGQARDLIFLLDAVGQTMTGTDEQGNPTTR